MNTPDWMGSALCAQVGGDLWYPDKAGMADYEQSFAQRAKRVCSLCDVRADCLAYALENDERDGIWGGLTPNARQQLLRARRAA